MSTSRSLNRVNLIGNLTRDPSMKQLANGAFITTFGMATNKSWKTQDGKMQEKAEYHNIVCWNKLAEICSNLLSLGMLVWIEGEITSLSWEENGEKMMRYEIRASDMKIMDNKDKKGVGTAQALINGKTAKELENEEGMPETSPASALAKVQAQAQVQTSAKPVQTQSQSKDQNKKPLTPMGSILDGSDPVQHHEPMPMLSDLADLEIPEDRSEVPNVDGEPRVEEEGEPLF